jgi:hypothetical protein
MKTIISAIFLSLLITPASRADEWTTQEISKQVAIGALFAIDAAQTLDIKRNPESWERNPLLGSHPSDKKIISYFLTAAILHTVLADSLSAKHRAWLQNGTIAVELIVVGNNRRIGLMVKL